MTKFKYILDSSEKFTCPSCNVENRFVKYRDVVTGDWVEDGHGRCDRENHCGHWKKIEDNVIIKDKSLIKYDLQRERTAIAEMWLTEDLFKNFKENKFEFKGEGYYNYARRDDIATFDKIPNSSLIKYINTFLRGIAHRFGKQKAIEVYKKFDLMTFFDGGVVFPYYDYDGRLLTGKIMFYDSNLKRIREGNKKYPQWLHNYNFTPEYAPNSFICDLPDYYVDLTFFNYSFDKLEGKKNVGIVESEKTAIIMSIVIPELHWMASGSLSGIQRYKFLGMNDKNILLFPDFGYLPSKTKHGKKITVAEYWEEKIVEEVEEDFGRSFFKTFKQTELVPPTATTKEMLEFIDDGSDIADFVLEYGDDYVKHLRDLIKNSIDSINF
jgi:hypothetical protein